MRFHDAHQRSRQTKDSRVGFASKVTFSKTAFLTTALATFVAGAFVPVAVFAQVPAQSSTTETATLQASAAGTDEAEQTRQLDRAEERRLSIGIHRASDWEVYGYNSHRLLAERLGQGRMLDLARARFQYQLHNGNSLYIDSIRALEDLDTNESVVLSAYGKLIRETLEENLGFEAWFDRKRSGLRTSSSARSESDDSGSELSSRSYRMRISPRFSDHYVGVKLAMPYAGVGGLDHLSFRARYDFETGNPRYALKYDNGSRLMFLSYEPDTENFGDEMSLSVRFLW